MNEPIFSHISQALNQSLPGLTGQVSMSPVPISNYKDPQKGYKAAGVVLLIHPKDGVWHVVFIERTSNHPNDKHAGQISFPGGKRDLSDETMLACAERELSEELGIDPSQYKILGPLSPIYVYVSNFLVSPFVALSDTQLSFVPEIAEVQRVIEYPLTAFLDFKNRKIKDFHIRNKVIKNMPYFDLYGAVLWGATAMILGEFITILQGISITETQLKIQ